MAICLLRTSGTTTSLFRFLTTLHISLASSIIYALSKQFLSTIELYLLTFLAIASYYSDLVVPLAAVACTFAWFPLFLCDPITTLSRAFPQSCRLLWFLRKGCCLNELSLSSSVGAYGRLSDIEVTDRWCEIMQGLYIQVHVMKRGGLRKGIVNHLLFIRERVSHDAMGTLTDSVLCQ